MPTTEIQSPQPAPRPLTAVKAFADSVLAMLDERIKAVDQAAHPFNDYFGDQPETIVAAKAQAGELREVRTQVRILGDRALVDLMKFKLAIPAPEGAQPPELERSVLIQHLKADHAWLKEEHGLHIASIGGAISALEYEQANPLGGPAKVFRAMAEAIEAGDSYEDTLRRYGFAEAAPAPQAPVATVEDNSQDWAGMDGTTAWHLIERHADNWADIGKMMGEWLAANQAAPSPAEGDELTARAFFERWALHADPDKRTNWQIWSAAWTCAMSQPQPKGMPAEWLDAFEEWRQTLGAADLDGKRDLVWRHIAGTGFQAGAAWARSQAPAPAQGSWVRAEDVQRLARDLDVAINGEAAAAPAPQLCDVVAQAIGIMDARRAEFPVVARWTKNAKDGAPRARVWVQFEDGGPEVEFASDLQAPAVRAELTDEQIDALLPVANLDLVTRGAISTGGGTYGREMKREPVWTLSQVRQAIRAALNSLVPVQGSV